MNRLQFNLGAARFGAFHGAKKRHGGRLRGDGVILLLLAILVLGLQAFQEGFEFGVRVFEFGFDRENLGVQLGFRELLLRFDVRFLLGVAKVDVLGAAGRP